MKSRILVIAGGVAALGALGMIPAHAGVNPTSGCSVPGPSSGASAVAPIPSNPTGSGSVYDGGSPTSGGFVGVQGTQGYLEAGGSTSGGGISGETPNGPGVAGSLNVSSSPSVCIGTNSASVSAP